MLLLLRLRLRALATPGRWQVVLCSIGFDRYEIHCTGNGVLAGWLAGQLVWSGLGGGAEPRAQRQRRDGRHLSSLLIHGIGRWQKPPRHVSARHVMSADRRVQGWRSVVDRNWKVRQAHLSAAQRPISDGNGSRPQKTSRRVKTGDAAA